jgi:hypothetical protein
MIKNLKEAVINFLLITSLILGFFLLVIIEVKAQSVPPEVTADGNKKDSDRQRSQKHQDGHSGQKQEGSSDSKQPTASSNQTHLPPSSPNPSNPAGASPGNPLGATQNPQPNLNTN